MTVQEQRDALLRRFHHCEYEAIGNGCVMRQDIDALIAAVRADARAPLEAEVERLREAWEHCPDRCACESCESTWFFSGMEERPMTDGAAP